MLQDRAVFKEQADAEVFERWQKSKTQAQASLKVRGQRGGGGEGAGGKGKEKKDEKKATKRKAKEEEEEEEEEEEVVVVEEWEVAEEDEEEEEEEGRRGSKVVGGKRRKKKHQKEEDTKTEKQDETHVRNTETKVCVPDVFLVCSQRVPSVLLRERRNKTKEDTKKVIWNVFSYDLECVLK